MEIIEKNWHTYNHIGDLVLKSDVLFKKPINFGNTTSKTFEVSTVVEQDGTGNAWELIIFDDSGKAIMEYRPATRIDAKELHQQYVKKISEAYCSQHS